MFNKYGGGSAPGRSAGNDAKADEFVGMGQALMRSQDARGALDFFDKALQINPRHELALMFKGTALGALGRVQEAETCFDRLLAQNPRSEAALFGKGMSVMQLHGRFEEALGYLEKSRALGYAGAAEAINVCKKMIAGKKNMSSNSQAADLIAKGRRIVLEDRWSEALACAEQALKLDPNSDAAWTVKGIALGGLGRAREAHAAYDKALAINNRNEDAWFNKGVEFREAGENERAIACYDKIIEFMPGYKMAWFNKGGALMVGLRRYREALVCYEEAQRLGVSHAAGAITQCRQLMGG